VGTKIATCCYCGTRAALVLRGEGRHELSCASCGAPLHLMKNLRADVVQDHASASVAGYPPRNRPVAPHPVRSAGQIDWSRAGQGMIKTGLKGKQHPKKRRSTARWLAGEIWDAVEDILD
jgi:hypothetical protein